MKEELLKIIVYIALGVALVLLFNQFFCSEQEEILYPVDDETVEQLREDYNESVEREKQLAISDSLKSVIIDSLQSVIRKIPGKIEKKQKQIDEEIAGDSTKAMEKNRAALRELGIYTDNLSHLSFREMGWNAKFLTSIPGLKLQVKKHEEKDFKQEERLKIKDKRLQEKDIQLSKADSLKIAAEKNMNYVEGLFEQTQSFWYSRFAVVGGGGFGYNGNQFHPFVGVTVGIVIWKNDNLDRTLIKK